MVFLFSLVVKGRGDVAVFVKSFWFRRVFRLCFGEGGVLVVGSEGCWGCNFLGFRFLVN